MRRYLTFGGSVLAAIAVGALLLGSCTSEPTTLKTPAKEEGPYGSLNLAVKFHSGTIFSPRGTEVASGVTFHQLGGGVFDLLVAPTPDGQVSPGIAERWQISPDGKTHTFYIRKGVKFQDGSDLTGADVKFSLETNLNPQNTSTEAQTWRAQVAKVELIDDYTVAVQLKASQFELLSGLPNFMGQGAVLPKKYIEEKGWDYFTRKPVGSGPWKVVELVPNLRLELEAVENHWRAVPKFKNLTLQVVNEEATKGAMLKTGELDLADVDPVSVSGLKAAGLRILPHYSASQWFHFILYDLGKPQDYALGDVRVRKALSLAINRQELAESIYYGYAQPSAIFFIPRTANFYDPAVLKPDPYDPEGAKRLLAEAGYSGGFTTKIWDNTNYGSLGTLGVQALAGYWGKVGVNAVIEPIDHATLTAMSGPRSYNTSWGGPSGGGIFGFERTLIYHGGKGSKHTRNPRLDDLIDKVPLTADPAEKKRLALEAAVLAMNEKGTLAILDVDTLFAFGPRVGEMIPVKGMRGLGFSLETMTHAK